MKALTLHQPWASLIGFGAKFIETRHWGTSYRGPLAIHAGLTSNRATTLMVLNDPLVSDFLRRNAIEWWTFPSGCLVAVGNLVDCCSTDYLVRNVNDLELACGNFGPDRYGWVLEDVELIDPPVPCRGMQGLWTVPEPLLDKITCIPHHCS